MKNIEKKIVIGLIVLISFFAIFFGTRVYNSKAYLDKFEMRFEDVHNLEETERDIYIAELKNFIEGEYTINFNYDNAEDSTLKVVSFAGYDYITDGLPVFLETTIPAGQGTFSSNIEFDDDYQAVAFILTTSGAVSVTDSKVLGDDDFFADRTFYYYFFVFVVAVFMLCAVYIVLTKKDRYDMYTSLGILLGLIALFVLATSIYILRNYSTYGCDTKFHLYRTKAIAESIANGNIPNRINGVSYFGYGYANPLLYPELFLYIPAFWMYKGMSDLGAIKLFYILINFIAVFIAYYSFEKICKNKYISIAATAVYTVSNYKLLNVYVRTALGETLFMTFLPLAIYALYTFFYEEKPRWFMLALSVAAIFQSQVLGVLLTCMILGAFFVIFAVDKIIKKEFKFGIFADLIKSVIWVALSNIWFIVPFLNAYFNYGLRMFDRETMVTWFFNEVLSAENFLSRTIMEGDKNVFSAVGLVVLVGIVGAVMFGILSVLKVKKDRVIILSTLAMTAFWGVICTDAINWQKLMQIKIIKVLLTTLQFSFRFEALFVMSLSFAIVLAFRNLSGKKIKLISIIFAGIVIMSSAFNMVDFIGKANFGRVDNTYRSYGVDEPLEYLKPGADVRQEILLEQKVTKSDNVAITSYSKDGINIDFSIETDGNEGWIQFPLFYYDDYTAVTESGKTLKTYMGDRALLYIEIPEDMGGEMVSMRFGNDMLYTYPVYVSLAFVFLSSAVMLYNLYRKNKK